MGSRIHVLTQGENVLSTTLVKILKGEQKEKGKEIPLSTSKFYFFPPLLSSLSLGVMGERKRYRLYSTDGRKRKAWNL